MKIKTKKQMTPEEYAKYMIDKHGIRGYESELIENYLQGAPERFSQKFELNPTLKEDVLTGSFRNGELTVEVEEEITEDTVLPKLVKYTYNSYYEHRDKSINMLDRAKEWSTFYYKDDNENMTLIWRDGKLVE